MISTLTFFWHAFSWLAFAGGLAGVALIVVGVLGLFSLPAKLRDPLMVTGAAILITAAIYQAGALHATHEAEVRLQQQIAEANKRRAEAAEKALAADRVRSAADAQTITNLQRQIDETPRNPGACLDRDAARRVRGIQ